MTLLDATMKRPTKQNYDPSPYDGPIARADGVRPYNHYLWPTESWWADRDLDRHVHSRWNFGIVALADGRFSIEGSVFSIQKNVGLWDRPCVFATRKAAIRVAAARMISTARASKNWGCHFGGLEGHKLARVINWALAVVARETDSKVIREVTVREPQPAAPVAGKLEQAELCLP